jgi:hypothetical protein
MPIMASITVKKADGTTNIVYDAVSASGGDATPAVWRQDTGANAALPVGLRSIFRMMTQWNGPKTARQVKVSFNAPYAVQDSTTTLFTAKDRALFDGNFTIPQGLPASQINEFVAQCFNLVASQLVVQSAQAGYAPN